MRNEMARLVNYRTRDENRYSTFDGEPSYNSRENLTDSNRIRLLSKQKKKLQKIKTKMAKNGNKHSKMPAETIPTISASIEMHRNKIAQSQTVNASSGEITRGRRRPATQSRHNAGSFNSTFNTRKYNWRSNQQQQQFEEDEEERASRDKYCCASCCFCCWCPRWWLKCCARICCGCINYEDSENEDDDIDAKFEQYKQEIRLNELKRERKRNDGAVADDGDEMQETSLQSNSYRIELSPSSTATNTIISYDDQQNPITNEGNVINAAEASTSSPDKTSKSTSIISRYRRYWSWNDSLRSNSDKFLETLEYDMDGEQSLKRTNSKQDRTDASARTKGCTPDLHVASSHA